MALANMDGYPIWAARPNQSSADQLSKMSVCKFTGREVFSFPDLPVKFLGFDHNLGK